MNRTARFGILLLVLGAAILSGCSRLVDEDLSDCGGTVRIDYRLRLVTNEQTELGKVLSGEPDIPVRNALQTYLKGIFTDIAHDADLTFRNTGGELLEHVNEIMDQEQFSCTLYLDAGTVRHTAAANTAENGSVSLDAETFVQHSDEDAVNPHRTGLFAGRGTFEVRPNAEQRIESDLYMVNAATALVLETAEAAGVTGIKAYVTGMADGFSLSDSTWTFMTAPMIRTDDLPVSGGTERCFASVHFPSRDYRSGTRSITETESPFLSDPAPEPVWAWHVYVQTADGSVTESVLSIPTPLRAGQLKILKAKVFDTGIVSVDDPLVGVSVTLDWMQGGDHNVEF